MTATREPEDPELISKAIQSALLEVHTSLIAHVVSWDPLTQKADVRPVTRGTVPTADGDQVTEDLPVIPGVRIAFFRSGGFSFTFPISVGDPVRLIFSESYSGTYRATGADASDPGLVERFGLSSAVALPCEERDANPLSPDRLDPADAVIAPSLRVGGLSALPVAMAALVQSAITTAITGHTHTGVTTGAGVSGTGALAVPVGSVASSNLKAEP